MATWERIALRTEEALKELQEKYDTLLEEFEQYKKESIKWDVIDFLYYEMDDGWSITEEQAQHALEMMIHEHDCEYGITWNTLEYYYTQYGTKVEVGKEKWQENLEIE
jgi:hypothetical protein